MYYPTIEFAYRKDLDTCDALLCVLQTLHSALESGQVQIMAPIHLFAAFVQLFSELPSASWVRHTRAAAAVHPLEFEVSRCETSQFARCFLPPQTRVWNDIPYNVFDTGTFDGFKEAVNSWSLP